MAKSGIKAILGLSALFFMGMVGLRACDKLILDYRFNKLENTVKEERVLPKEDGLRNHFGDQIIYDRIQDEINQIAVYADFNGRRMTYKDFTKATGIEKKFAVNDVPVYVNVVPGSSDITQELYPAEGGTFYVNFKVPYKRASEVRHKLAVKINKYHGITPLKNKDFENLPVGGY